MLIEKGLAKPPGCAIVKPEEGLPMDIAALSVVSNHVQLKQQASLSVMKMVMNASQEQTNSLLAMAPGISGGMESSVNPHLGSKLDVLV